MGEFGLEESHVEHGGTPWCSAMYTMVYEDSRPFLTEFRSVEGIETISYFELGRDTPEYTENPDE